MPVLRFDFQNPWILLFLCLILLTTPVTWIIAWAFAMVIHEIGHLLMLKLLSVRVSSVVIGLTGARIVTEPLEPLQELICAAAGPAAGALLILAGRFVPLCAVFAFFQTLWNLLPVGDRDGRRILWSLATLIRNIPCKPAKERVQ